MSPLYWSFYRNPGLSSPHSGAEHILVYTLRSSSVRFDRSDSAGHHAARDNAHILSHRSTGAKRRKH